MSTVSPAHTAGRRPFWGSDVHVGIEIGSEGISLVSVLGRKRRRISQAIYRPYAEVIKPRQLDGPALARLVLRELPRRCDNRRRPATVCLPPSLGLTRVVQAASAAKALEQVQQEAEADSCHAVWPLPQPESFMAHTVETELVEAAATAVDSLGYDCTAVLPHPVAVWQCRRLAQETCCAVLDWSLDACTLVTGSDDGLGVVRQLPGCGLLAAIETASPDSVDVNRWVAALRTLAAMARSGAGDAAGEHAGDRRQLEGAQRYFASRIRHVAEEVRQTLAYGRRFGAGKTEQLFVTGIGAFLLGQPFAEIAGLTVLPPANQFWASRRRTSVPGAGRCALLSKAAALGFFPDAESPDRQLASEEAVA